MGIHSLGGASIAPINQFQAMVSEIRSANDGKISYSYDPVDRNDSSKSILTLKSDTGKTFSISKLQAQRIYNLMARADADKDGVVTPEEMKNLMEQLKSELERMKKMESDMKVVRAIQAYKSSMEDQDTSGNISNDIKMLGELQKSNVFDSSISEEVKTSSGTVRGVSLGLLANTINA